MVLLLLGLSRIDAQADNGIKNPSDPEFGTAGYVLEGCSILAKGPQDGHWDELSPATKDQLWLCAGAILATGQIMVNQHEFCAPRESSNMESYRVVSKYMRSHPEELGYSLGGVIYEALHQAWPCPPAEMKKGPGSPGPSTSKE